METIGGVLWFRITTAPRWMLGKWWSTIRQIGFVANVNAFTCFHPWLQGFQWFPEYSQEKNMKNVVEPIKQLSIPDPYTIFNRSPPSHQFHGADVGWGFWACMRAKRNLTCGFLWICLACTLRRRWQAAPRPWHSLTPIVFSFPSETAHLNNTDMFSFKPITGDMSCPPSWPLHSCFAVETCWDWKHDETWQKHDETWDSFRSLTSDPYCTVAPEIRTEQGFGVSTSNQKELSACLPVHVWRIVGVGFTGLKSWQKLIENDRDTRWYKSKVEGNR